MTRDRDITVDLRPLGGRVVSVRDLAAVRLSVYDESGGLPVGRMTLEDIVGKFL